MEQNLDNNEPRINEILVITNTIQKLIVYQQIPIRPFGFFHIGTHKVWPVFGKKSFRHHIYPFSITGATEKCFVLGVAADVGIEFPFWKHIF